MTGEVRRGSAGPVAMHSKFGLAQWILLKFLVVPVHIDLTNVTTIPDQDPIQDMLHVCWSCGYRANYD